MNKSEATNLLSRVNRWSVVVTQNLSHIVDHHCQSSKNYKNGSYFTNTAGTEALTSTQIVQTYGAKILNMLQDRQRTLYADPRGTTDTFLVAKQIPPKTGADPRARSIRPTDRPGRGREGPTTYGGSDCHWLVCVVKKVARPKPAGEPIVVTTAYPATQLYVQNLKRMM